LFQVVVIDQTEEKKEEVLRGWWVGVSLSLLVGCFGGGSYCPIPDELYFIRKMSKFPEFIFPSNPPIV